MAINYNKDSISTPINEVKCVLHNLDGTTENVKIDAVLASGRDELVWKRSNRLHIIYNRYQITNAYFDFTVPPKKDNQRFIFANEYELIATHINMMRSSDGVGNTGYTGMGLTTTRTIINDSMQPSEIMEHIRTLGVSEASIIVCYGKDEAASIQKWTVNLNSIKKDGEINYAKAFRNEIGMSLRCSMPPPSKIYTEIVWIVFVWNWLVYAETDGYHRTQYERKGNEDTWHTLNSNPNENTSYFTKKIKGAIAMKREYDATQETVFDLTMGIEREVYFKINQDGFNSGSYYISSFSSTPV